MIRAALVCAAPGIPFLGPSGSSVHLRGVARALERRSVLQVVVATLADARGAHDSWSGSIRAVEARRWPAGLRTVGAHLEGGRVARAVAVADLLWERHAPPALVSGPACFHVLEVNAPGRERWGRDRWPWSALERRHLERVDRVIAVSRWAADWASAWARDVRLVPNGSEVGPLPDRQTARSALGVDGAVVAFVGSGQAWQGAHRLPSILDGLPGWTLLHVGPVAPPAHPQLRALGPRWASDRDAVYAAADVLIAPYTAAAPPWLSPLKRVDAAAGGRPLVIGRIGDVTEAQPGEIVLAPEASAGQWAEAVRAAATYARKPAPRTWDAVVEEAVGDYLNSPN